MCVMINRYIVVALYMQQVVASGNRYTVRYAREGHVCCRDSSAGSITISRIWVPLYVLATWV